LRPVVPPGGDGDVALLEDFAHAQVLPSNNWWNLDISSAPIDPNSQNYIDWISGRDDDDPDDQNAGEKRNQKQSAAEQNLVECQCFPIT
jgi:hypothetical protein